MIEQPEGGEEERIEHSHLLRPPSPNDDEPEEKIDSNQKRRSKKRISNFEPEEKIDSNRANHQARKESRKMDKGWINSTNWLSKEYLQGIEQFIEFAYTNKMKDSTIYCPCKKCLNRYHVKRLDVRAHLIFNGFSKKYKNWTYHGEISSSIHGNQEDQALGEPSGITLVELRQQIRDELRAELRQQIRAELRDEIRKEIRSQLATLRPRDDSGGANVRLVSDASSATLALRESCGDVDTYGTDPQLQKDSSTQLQPP